MDEMNEQDILSQPPTNQTEALLQAYHSALQTGDAQQVEAAALEFFVHACEQMGTEPSPSLLLKQEAHRHEAAGQWQEAETAYRQSLALAQEQNIPAMEYKAHAELSDLYSFLNQNEPAQEEAQAALEAARRSDMKILLGMALEGSASHWLGVGNISQAFAEADEMVKMLPTDRMYDLQRARALVLRARCTAGLQQFEAAQQDLETAWPILAPMADATILAGNQSALAHWWEVTAHLKSLNADFEGSADAWRQAVAYRRNVSQAPQLEGPYKYAWLAHTLHKFGQALLAVEDVVGAESAFRERQALQSAIQQP